MAMVFRSFKHDPDHSLTLLNFMWINFHVDKVLTRFSSFIYNDLNFIGYNTHCRANVHLRQM